MMNDKLLESVKMHEGLRLRAYQDTLGVWTVGYGRNLQELEISPAIAEQWLKEDLWDAQRDARSIPEWEHLDTVARRNVIIEMVFNIGKPRLLLFKRMWEAIRLQDWQLAAHEMLDSKWADQVGQRARTLAHIMGKGTYT
jgi:lysozyme